VWLIYLFPPLDPAVVKLMAPIWQRAERLKSLPLRWLGGRIRRWPGFGKDRAHAFSDRCFDIIFRSLLLTLLLKMLTNVYINRERLTLTTPPNFFNNMLTILKSFIKVSKSMQYKLYLVMNSLHFENHNIL